MNKVLLIFIAVTSISYLLYIVIRYGIQKSISASYNVLETPIKKSLYGWFMLAVALPMMIVSDNTLGWWAGAILAVDFAAPTGGDKMRHAIHCICADAGMMLGVLMIGAVFQAWWLVILTVIMVVIAYYKLKNKTWWIEIIVLCAVWLGLIIEKW